MEKVGNHKPIPYRENDTGGGFLIPAGRMGQLGKIHVVNTRAFLEAARLVMVEYGGYSDSEVDVLCECRLRAGAGSTGK